jgi:16S rRNA processing protein RimM
MGREAPTHLVVGQITKPHGIQGEVVVRPLSDHPEGIFSPGVVLFPALPRHAEPDPERAALRIDSVRPFQGGFLVAFDGVPDRNAAELLRRTELVVPADQVAPRQEGELFYHELPGLEVQDTAGVGVGRVVEVFETEPNVLLEVRTRRGSVLIPFVSAVVVDVRLEERILVVDPPPGLLDL